MICLKCKWEGERSAAVKVVCEKRDYYECPECHKDDVTICLIEVEYTPEVDRMLRAYPYIDDWTPDEWLELAKAALDQAGWKPECIKEALREKESNE